MVYDTILRYAATEGYEERSCASVKETDSEKDCKNFIISGKDLWLSSEN